MPCEFLLFNVLVYILFLVPKPKSTQSVLTLEIFSYFFLNNWNYVFPKFQVFVFQGKISIVTVNSNLFQGPLVSSKTDLAYDLVFPKLYMPRENSLWFCFAAASATVIRNGEWPSKPACQNGTSGSVSLKALPRPRLHSLRSTPKGIWVCL